MLLQMFVDIAPELLKPIYAIAPLAVAGIMAVPALIQAGMGVGQAISGKVKEKRLGEQPKYEIPQEVYQSLNLAQRQAFEGLPAEQKQQFVENLRAMQTTGLSQLSDRKSGLAGVGQLASTATQGYRNLLAMDAAARQANIQGYQQQLGEMAGYRDLAYQTNQLQPYQREFAYARGLQGAGLQNIYGGIQGIGSAASTAAGMGAFDQPSTAGGDIFKQSRFESGGSSQGTYTGDKVDYSWG